MGMMHMQGALDPVEHFEVPSTDQIVGLTYDGFVAQLCAWAGPDFSVDSVLHWLRDSLSVDIDGGCRVYWPQAQPWVVAYNVSPRAALIVARLLEDDRLVRLVEGQRRDGGSAYINTAPTRALKERASGVDPFKPSSRSTDVFMRVELAPATPAHPRPTAFQPNPATTPQQVLIDDVLAADDAVPNWPTGIGPNR